MNTRVKIDINLWIIEIEWNEDFVREKLELYESKLLLWSFKWKNEISKNESRTLEKNNTIDKKGKNTKTKSIKPERFDYMWESWKETLKDFYERKKPWKNNQDIIVTIWYYIQDILEKNHFTEWNVEFAYKILNIKRPLHLRQIMLNTKSQRDLITQVEWIESGWELTRAGEIFASQNLPTNND